jgi:hypothetical protein
LFETFGGGTMPKSKLYGFLGMGIIGFSFMLGALRIGATIISVACALYTAFVISIILAGQAKNKASSFGAIFNDTSQKMGMVLVVFGAAYICSIYNKNLYFIEFFLFYLMIGSFILGILLIFIMIASVVISFVRKGTRPK